MEIAFLPFSSASASLTFNSVSWASSLAFSASLASSNCFLILAIALLTSSSSRSACLMAFSISFLARCSSLICSLIARCSSLCLLLELLDRHRPFHLLEPRVQIFLLDSGVLVDLAVLVDQGVGVLDLLDRACPDCRA